MKGLHYHENYPRLQKLGFSESFKVKKKSRNESFFRRGVVKHGTFYQNVRPLREHFHISHENQSLGLKFQVSGIGKHIYVTNICNWKY